MSSTSVSIEHIAHPEWSRPNDFNGDMFADLHSRFDGTPVPVLEVAQVIEKATAQVEWQRRDYEHENFSKLDLTHEDRMLYKQLSGSREHIGKYMRFFGLVAMRTLQHAEQRDKVAKVSLQLAGKRQFGDWDCTHELDEFARAIPAELQKVEPATVVKLVGGDRTRHNRYEFRPLDLETQSQPGRIDYGIIRRRRPVADIFLPRLLPIEIFKESRAVLVTGQTDEFTRELITDNAELLSSEERDEEIHSAVAAATGNAFERAITALKGRTRDVIPVSADYFAVMRNPLFYPEITKTIE